MRLLKKLSIVLCSVLLLSVLCGCTEKELTLEELVKKYTEAQRDIKSSSIIIDADISANDESSPVPINIKVSSSMDIINNPISLKADTTINISSIINMDMVTYSIQEGSDFNIYTGLKMGDNIIWEKETEEIPDMSGIIPSTNLNIDILDYELIGKENIDGKDTYHLVLSLSPEKMIDLLESFSVDNQLSIDNNFGELAATLESLKMDLWISTKDYRTVKSVIDAKTFLNSLLGDTSNLFEKAIITMSSTGYNNIDKIEIPQEALEADNNEENYYNGLFG